RKVILGINNTFPNNSAWRFFPSYASFPNPTMPFSSGLPPETISITNLQSNYTSANFTGLKVGDVNNSADPKY
ncbi:MAG: hypothetical protein KDC70_15220, partial [Saprospiraceae bacterium]|nr:hypothetical protein [Saprospiraceae bacterium]